MIIRFFLVLALFSVAMACAPKEPPTNWKGISDYMKQNRT